jgi:hypothetical protein
LIIGILDHDVRKGQQPPWIVSDELWARIEPLLPVVVPRRSDRPGRPRLDDRKALADQDDQSERLTVRRRMIEWYVQRAAAADKVINPFPRRFSPVYDDLDTGVFDDAEAASDWADTERANLLAAQQVAADLGWTELVYQFGEVLWNPLRPNYTAAELVRSQFRGANAAADAGHILEVVRDTAFATSPLCMTRSPSS